MNKIYLVVLFLIPLISCKNDSCVQGDPAFINSVLKKYIKPDSSGYDQVALNEKMNSGDTLIFINNSLVNCELIIIEDSFENLLYFKDDIQYIYKRKKGFRSCPD